MDVWLPQQESPSTPKGDNSDATRSPGSGRPETSSIAPVPSTTKPALPSNVTDVAGISLSRAGVVEASTNNKPDPVSGETRFNPSCSRNYLVLARLFKMHPGFDAAIEGILAGDDGGCVVLIHETRDEEWTRVVWTRLREALLPRGMLDS